MVNKLTKEHWEGILPKLRELAASAGFTVVNSYFEDNSKDGEIDVLAGLNFELKNFDSDGWPIYIEVLQNDFDEPYVALGVDAVNMTKRHDDPYNELQKITANDFKRLKAFVKNYFND